MRAGRGNSGCSHDIFGKSLATFKLGSCCAGTKTQNAHSANRVSNSSNQGCLGSNDDQINPEVLGKCGNGCGVACININVGRVFARSAVARGAPHISDRGVEDQGTH
jgi:hypothetical protein